MSESTIDTTEGSSSKSEHPPIEILVKTTYIQEQSRPTNNRYVYAYTITIKNCFCRKRL